MENSSQADNPGERKRSCPEVILQWTAVDFGCRRIRLFLLLLLLFSDSNTMIFLNLNLLPGWAHDPGLANQDILAWPGR